MAERRASAENGEDIKSVVELFAESSSEDADGLRSDDLVDFLLTFIVAACDTTALALSWLFYALGKHPDVMKKLQNDLMTRLPESVRNDITTYVTTEHIKHFPYLDAAIKEALRLYPPVPSTLKQVVRDTVVCGDIPLLKGQLVALPTYAMGRNPDVWGPDANEFKPERWIDPGTGQLRHVPSSKFSTFHSGPRTCIGMNLAMLELRLVVANLLHRFDFDIDPANSGAYLHASTLVMRDPLFSKVSIRSAGNAT
ncbi:hypothetical protein Poli38472_008234 [Pythium oligandrum]|uniref:Cytochrome P450 n=1 Tax=Pythium oligandrum TaxID=41045 RepID=A0A8K1CNE8_PYTOL|nr:hypothetical protein Poli38472_008234 [Pythium oligandrum]|eukprot:TMW65592.1 hypothetical protein Poli38472_008234 [Pythium oligandrum]